MKSRNITKIIRRPVEPEGLDIFFCFNKISLLNCLYVKMMMKDCQDLGTMVGPMVGKVKKDFPARAGGP